METIIYEEEGLKVAEVVSSSILIRTAQDALDLMMNLAASDVRKLIVRQENITPEFFSLRTGLAGEVLQKFVNYRVQLAIVGDFKNIPSESLKALILESNRGKQVFFLKDVEAAKQALFRASL